MHWRSTSSTQICSSCLSPTFTCMFPKYTAGHWRDGSLRIRGQSPGETGAQGKSLRRSEEFFLRVSQCDKEDLAKLSFSLQGGVILRKDEDCSSAVCCRVVCLERHSCPEDLRFQRSELWWIEGKQQEGHGDSTEGTFLCVNTTSRAKSTWNHTVDGSYLLLLLPPRFSLGATCVWFRRSETLKEKQYKLWWRIWTGESFHGFQF